MFATQRSPKLSWGRLPIPSNGRQARGAMSVWGCNGTRLVAVFQLSIPAILGSSSRNIATASVSLRVGQKDGGYHRLRALKQGSYWRCVEYEKLNTASTSQWVQNVTSDTSSKSWQRGSQVMTHDAVCDQ